MAIRNLVSVIFSRTTFIVYPKIYFHSNILSCKIARKARLSNLNVLCSKFLAIPAEKLSKYAPNTMIIKEHDAKKINIIKDLNFETDTDAQPFYNLPVKTLLHIYKTTKKDEEHGYCKNRLYYIAERIKVRKIVIENLNEKLFNNAAAIVKRDPTKICPPFVLSQRIIRRTFIYNLPFNWLESSLNVLLDMGVAGDRILRDLWVLKYHHKTIYERLHKVKNSGVDILYPWMVRCSEDILKRSIQIFQETKTILGSNKSTKMYLANRLKMSPETIDDIYIKVPALKTTRAVKVKNFLDFLLEQGFSLEDIASKARILAASQNTVKQRLEKLRSLGLHTINLNVLCRSRKDFQKYCESIEAIAKEQS